ncbi:MAG: flagellar biosynthetic protein FliR [Thermaerobacter sp.]|nr:flagellar biosynthetic protein FliR [Thermaerobacter sp.]
MSAILTTPYVVWGPALLVFARVVSLFGTAPVTGAPVLPPTVRILLSILVGWFALSTGIPATPPPEAVLPLALLAQVLVGAGIGLLSTLIFNLFHTAGAILDAELGFTIAQVFNPFSAAGSETLIANWFDSFGTYFFLAIGGVELLVLAAVQSFRVVPLDVTRLVIGPQALAATVQAFVGSFLVAVEIAAPVVLALLLIDLIGAVLGRLLPQLNILTFNIPLKMWLGMGLVAIALPLLTDGARLGLLQLGQSITEYLGGI